MAKKRQPAEAEKLTVKAAEEITTQLLQGGKKGSVVTKITIDITTKNNHNGYLTYCCDSLPKIYLPLVKKQPTGYQIIVQFSSSDGSQYFVSRYLANLVSEIRVLDESNLKVETITEPAEEPVE